MVEENTLRSGTSLYFIAPAGRTIFNCVREVKLLSQISLICMTVESGIWRGTRDLRIEKIRITPNDRGIGKYLSKPRHVAVPLMKLIHHYQIQ